MRILSATLFFLFVTTGCGTDEVPDGDTATTTWHQDIAPLVAGHCQTCHVAGGIAPFPLTTFEEAAPFAPQIAAMVESRTMPPYGAIPRGDCAPPKPFLDDLSLTNDEIAKIRAWVDRGVPAGDAASAAPLPVPPNRSLEGVTKTVQPRAGFTTSGTRDQFICLVYDPGLTADAWLTGLEFLPTSKAVVHHAIAYADPTRAADSLVGPDGTYGCGGGAMLPNPVPLGGYTPGALPFEQPPGSGIRVPAGSLIVVQMHYHPLAAGAPTHDSTALALRLSPTFPGRDALWVGVGNDFSPGVLQPGPNDVGGLEFRVPANVRDHTEQMRIRIPIDEGVQVPLFALYPHMHFSGSRMEVRVEHADGTRECLIDAGRYDFKWQRGYMFDAPVADLPRLRFGDTLEITCTYDNTLANPNVQWALAEQNLGAPVDLFYGEETINEMCVVLAGVVAP